MKRIALVLVAVLLVVMVGACGREEAKPTETEAVTTTRETVQEEEIERSPLYQLYIDFAAKSLTSYDIFVLSVLNSIDTSGIFEELPQYADEGYVYKYNKLVDIEGLKGTVFTGDRGEGEFLYIYFYLKDNPVQGGLKAIHKKASQLGKEAFRNAWIDDLHIFTIEMGDAFYAVAVIEHTDTDCVVIGMSKEVIAP